MKPIIFKDILNIKNIKINKNKNIILLFNFLKILDNSLTHIPLSSVILKSLADLRIKITLIDDYIHDVIFAPSTAESDWRNMTERFNNLQIILDDIKCLSIGNNTQDTAILHLLHFEIEVSMFKYLTKVNFLSKKL